MSGLVIMPGAILNGIMSVYTGKIYDKYGPRLLILIGFIILIVTTASLSFLKYDSSYTMLVVVCYKNVCSFIINDAYQYCRYKCT